MKRHTIFPNGLKGRADSEMRIFIVNSVCGTGSTGRIVTDIMNQAKVQGYTVKVACSTVEPIRNIAPEDAVVVGSKRDYYIHNVLSRITDHEGLYSKQATRKLVRGIDDFKPDIVHLHNLHGHWINYEILCSYLSKHNIKVVWTLHDCWAFTGHCAHFSVLGCEQWKTHCSHCVGLQSYPRCYGKGDVSGNYEKKRGAFTSLEEMTIVTPSEWLANMVRSSFLGCYKVHVINNGIDLNVFKPTESKFRETYGLQKKKIVLGVANVWIKKKGYEDILALSEMLDSKYQIVLVGLTREQILNLPDNILGIERTQNIQHLVEIYSTADVFINPSYEETMGLVTAEAMACGTPAVVYNQTAVPEVVDEHSGLVVQAGDLIEMRQAIYEIVEDQRRFSNTRKRAEKYEKAKQYKKYIKLYEEVLGL